MASTTPSPTHTGYGEQALTGNTRTSANSRTNKYAHVSTTASTDYPETGPYCTTEENHNELHENSQLQIHRSKPQHDHPHVRGRRIQPGQTRPSHHPPSPLLARPPRPTTTQPNHATPTPQRKGPTMNNHPLTEQLLNLVEKHQDAAGYPDWKSLEPEFDQTVRPATAAFWQDGHDTALLHGQSKNPYNQEPR